MKALIISCSPVRKGAAAEIAGIVSEELSGRYTVKNICIDDFDIGFCEDVFPRKKEILDFCKKK